MIGRARHGVLLVVLCGLLFQGTFAQIDKAEPPHWWVGFQQKKVQLLLHGKDLGRYELLLEHPTVEILEVHRAKSLNYLFVDLFIGPDTEAGELVFELKAPGKRKRKWKYELKTRKTEATQIEGFDSSDVLYLITPDRFVNADPGNDRVAGMLEQGVNRQDDYARHGGDIAGIIQALPYLEQMGFTALWSSPLLENNMPEQSYHGYAITDYYKVDPRFGELKDYVGLAEACQERGIKLIMDQVANHCGRHHWWMKDLPFEDWVNQQDRFEAGLPLSNSNHRRTTHQDPYASKADQEGMTTGWFVEAMPDLNQGNPFMAEYLIQNSIWWIETLQLGGIRQDTYPYPDKEFMSEWAGRILREYPQFSIVGEEWSYNPLLVGYWQEGAKNADGYRSNLPSTMDFPMQKALTEALVEEERWDQGLIKLYEGLANDFYYPHPKQLMLFSDNHDMDRIATQLKEDPELVRMAMAFLLTSPRIPQLYYGTEILMQNSAKPGDHGLIRTDFPGGWQGDAISAIEGKGLTQEQRKTQDYLKRLLQFRKNAPVLHKGNTTHFAPEQGTYALFRVLGEEVVVLILNKNEKPTEISLDRFDEMKLQGRSYLDVIEQTQGEFGDRLLLSPKSATILHFKS